jgi:hypothetical protein
LFVIASGDSFIVLHFYFTLALSYEIEEFARVALGDYKFIRTTKKGSQALKHLLYESFFVFENVVRIEYFLEYMFNNIISLGRGQRVQETLQFSLIFIWTRRVNYKISDVSLNVFWDVKVLHARGGVVKFFLNFHFFDVDLRKDGDHCTKDVGIHNGTWYKQHCS